MAQLTLLDVAANEEIVVPPEGFVFGRVGGDADIQLEDNSISRRQARVSNRQGTWVLEVMVVPPGQRLPRPQALQQGQQFSIGATEFEVLAVEDEEEPAAPTIAPSRSKPGPAPVAAPIKKSAAPAKAAPPPDRTAPATPAQKRPPAKAAPPPQDDEPQDDAGGGDAPAEGGIKALFVGVPKGIAYFLLNVPKMLVNPLGTVRKGIDELPTPPLAKTALIGYGVPAYGVSLGLPIIASMIASLIHAQFSFPIIPLAINLAVGAAIAVGMGFFFHPATAWVINKMQGESDERSRSNYYLQLMTVVLIVAIPNALAQVLGTIRWLNLLAPVLVTVASLVGIYVNYQWLVFFKVHKVIPKVVLVLGLLTTLGGLFGLIGTLRADISWAGTPSISDSGSGGGDTPSTDPALAEQPGEENLPAETRAQLAAARKEAAKAMAAGQAAADKANEDLKNAAKATEDATRNAGKASKKNPDDDAPPPVADKAKPPEKKQPEQVAKNDPPPEPAARNDPPADEPSRDSGGAAGGYGTYAHLRDAVEKRLEADPTVLAKDKDLQSTYRDYLNDVADIDAKYDKERAKNREPLKLNQHLRDAELYEKTGGALQKIAGKLHVK